MKVLGASIASKSLLGSASGKFRVMARDAQSEDAAANVGDILTLSTTSSLKGSMAKFQIDGKDAAFNNSTGALSFMGRKIDLKKVGLNTRTTRNLVFQVDATDPNDVKLNVFKDGESKGFQFNVKANNWKPDTDNPGKYDPEAANLVASKASLIFNNGTQGTVNGTGANDVIINRNAEASINAGAGDDVIFNFADSVTSLDGGDGGDAIYSVGLKKGAISTGGAGADKTDYIKLTGNMSGGSIALGTGKSILDASGKSLKLDSLTGTGSSNAVIAKSISGGTVNLQAAQVAVDVGTLAADLTMGSGKNSLVADTVKGKTVKGSGHDTFSFKTLDGATIDETGNSATSLIKVTGSAKKTTFKLGTGTNTLDASGKTLTSVTISGGGGAAVNAVKAGSITGTTSDKSSITLTGNTTADQGTGIAVSGAVNNTNINITGLAEITAKTIKDSAITLAGAGNKLVDILSTMTNTKVEAGGSNDLTVKVKGTVSGSSIKSSLKTSITTGAVKAGASDKIELTGAFANQVSLGSFTGTKLVNAADNNIIMSGAAEQTLTIRGAAKNAYFQGTGNGNKVTVEGSVSDSRFDLGSGSANNSFTAQKGSKAQSMKNVTITATTSGKNTITAGAYSASEVGHKLELLGTGTNEVTLSSISGKGAAAAEQLAITLGTASSTAAQKLTVAGAVKNLKYTGNDGVDTITLGGAVTDSKFTLGAGSDVFKAVKGTSGQSLKNTTITSSGGDTEVTAGAAGNLTYTGSADVDKITLSGAVTGSTFTLGAGNDVFKAEKNGKGQALKDTTITSSGGDTKVTAGAYSATEAGHKIELLGTGTNEVTLSSVSGKGAVAAEQLAITLGTASSTAAQKLTVAGAVKNLKYIGDDGVDTITLGGAVSGSTFTLGAGDDVFKAEKNGKGQALKNTTITSSGGDTKVTAGAYSATEADHKIELLGSGANEVTLSSIAGKGAVAAEQLAVTLGTSTSTAAQKLTVAGAVKNLKYTGNNGVDTINLGGAITGSAFTLGAGNDVFTAEKNGKGQSVKDTSIISGGGDTTIKAGAATNLTYTGSAGVDKITLSGTVTGSTFTLGAGNDEFTAMKGTTGQTLKNTTITSSGGDTKVTAGAYSATEVDHKIELLGTGANEVTLSSVSGKGINEEDRLAINLGDSSSTATQKLTVVGAVKNLKYEGNNGDDEVRLGGAVSSSCFEMWEGGDTFEALKNGKGQTLTNVSIESLGGNATVKAGALNSNAKPGNFGMTPHNVGIYLSGANNTVELSSVSGADATAMNPLTIDGAQKLTVAGAVKNLIYRGTNDADTVTLGGAVTNSRFNLYDGDDEFKAVKGTTGQSLKDTTIISTGGDTTVTAGSYSGTSLNEINLQGSGTNTVKLTSVSGKSDTDRAVIKMAGTATLEVEGAVKNLNYTGGAGVDTIKIIGSSVANSTFTLGDGNNLFQAGRGYDGSGKLTTKGATMSNVYITAGTGDDEVITGAFKSGEVNMGGGNNKPHTMLKP